MTKTYRATYIDAIGRQFPATIFLSSVTITIRFKNELNEEKDIYWLAGRIQSMQTAPLDTRLFYPVENDKQEQLLVRDEDLKLAIQKHFSSYKFSGAGVRHRLFNSTRSKILLGVGVFVLLLAMAYLWLLPWIGERVAMNFSKEYEIELGAQMYQASMKTYKVDEVKTKAINNFYQQLHYNTGYPIKVTVVSSPDINAFAIPGGNIVVYDALLKKITTPEQLAALLGHEASHIQKRHSLKSLFRGLARKMFLLMLVGNDSGMIGFLADNADELKGLQYSRALETEADDGGLQLMETSQLNGNGMLELMEILDDQTKDKDQPSNFLSTHPVFEIRIAHIKEQLKTAVQKPKAPSAIQEAYNELQSSW